MPSRASSARQALSPKAWPRPRFAFHLLLLGVWLLVGLVAVDLASMLRSYSLHQSALPTPPSKASQRADELPEVTRVASYDFDVTFIPEEHSLRGRETLKLKNISRQPLKKLYFHLYLNAFKNEESLFLRSRQTRGGIRKAPLGRLGGIFVDKISSESFPGAELELQPEGDAKDETQASLNLPRPLLPGEELRLDFEIEARLPELIERTGYVADFHFFGQFFPKLAKLEEDGSFQTFDFHPTAEFYANFGDYRMRLRAPEGYEVVAPGQLRTTPHGPGELSHEIEAKARVDLAFALSPKLETIESSFSSCSGKEVHLRLYAPPASRWTQARNLATLKAGLRFLEKKLYPYPYPELTLLHVPVDAAAAGGMEYPGLITTTARPIGSLLPLRELEWITIHELSHQYFQSTLASDEASQPFLDESLATLVEGLYLEAEYGNASLSLLPPISQQALDTSYRNTSARKILAPASEMADFSELSRVIYGRAPLILTTFRNLVAEDRFDAALQFYARQNRFAHPTLADFYAAFAEHLRAKELNYLKKALSEDGEYFVRLKRAQRRDQVYLEAQGVAPFALKLALICDDSQKKELRVHPSDGRTLLSLPCAAQSLIIDPEHHFLLDENYLDNQLGQDELLPAWLGPFAILSTWAGLL